LGIDGVLPMFFVATDHSDLTLGSRTYQGDESSSRDNKAGQTPPDSQLTNRRLVLNPESAYSRDHHIDGVVSASTISLSRFHVNLAAGTIQHDDYMYSLHVDRRDTTPTLETKPVAVMNQHCGSLWALFHSSTQPSTPGIEPVEQICWERRLILTSGYGFNDMLLPSVAMGNSDSMNMASRHPPSGTQRHLTQFPQACSIKTSVFFAELVRVKQ